MRRFDAELSIVHCACLPDELFESELFGHVAGAFTGAETDQEGLLEAAGGGTLLLDEIGELALPSQAKLLRFLESRSVRRPGSTETRLVDVRILAATSVRLDEAVAAGRSARTSTGACGPSISWCRRSGSGARTSRSSPGTSSSATRRGSTAPSRSSCPTALYTSSAASGRGTSASSSSSSCGSSSSPPELEVRSTKLYDWMRDLGLDIRELRRRLRR